MYVHVQRNYTPPPPAKQIHDGTCTTHCRLQSKSMTPYRRTAQTSHDVLVYCRPLNSVTSAHREPTTGVTPTRWTVNMCEQTFRDSHGKKREATQANIRKTIPLQILTQDAMNKYMERAEFNIDPRSTTQFFRHRFLLALMAICVS